MAYRVIDPETVEPEADRESELRRLTDAVGLSNMAMNRFVATPGDQIPLMYHAHDDQEEVFYVVSGTLQVETPEQVYEVPAGSLFVAEPGSPHRAYNAEDADDPVTVLAIGAPQSQTATREYVPDE